MTTETLTLPAFLLARIAEDEAIARAAVGDAIFQNQTGSWSFEAVATQYGSMPVVFAVADGGGKTQVARLDGGVEQGAARVHIARWDPDRVLAECAAKREIALSAGDLLRAYDRAPVTGDEARDEAMLSAANIYEETLRQLAAPYADHPHYRSEWSA